MIIESKAPTRIDLAGGTIDLWPLYLFHKDPVTVNLAIDQYAKVRIKTRRDKKIILESKDLKIKKIFNSINNLKHDHKLSLFSRLIEYYQPKKGIEVTSECMAPAGAGLAGSSALNIALNGALNKLTNKGLSKQKMITVAKNIEAICIKVPTGWQDYFPEMYGGLNIVHLDKKEVYSEKIEYNNDLEDQLVVCYTGKPRMSGTNNWEIMKNHIDRKKKIFEKFEKIIKTSKKMANAVINKKYNSIGRIFDEEWSNRKLLSKTVSTKKIDKLIKLAKNNGAIAGKVCGAGGGGCIVFFAKKGKKGDLSKALSKESKVIDFRIVKEGLRVISK